MSKIQELRDLMYTIRNGTRICDILLNNGEWELIPTICEYIYERAQEVVDSFCVKED